MVPRPKDEEENEKRNFTIKSPTESKGKKMT